MIKEAEIQAGLVEWLYKSNIHFAANLEGSKRDRQYGARLKRQGMRHGRPDIEIYLSGSKTVFIELKRKGNTLTDNQKEEHERLKSLGFNVHTVTAVSVPDAIDQVKAIIYGVREENHG